jgi:tetratricopeptide (TPR) repeat protein
LKGRFYWAKRTEEGLYKGIQYFRQAIELDPTYALAYAGLAEGYVPLAVYCHLAPKDACPKARAAAHAALEIDPRLSEARTVLGGIMSYYDWDLENGEKELRQAAALDPKYPRARQTLAENLTIRGCFEEALIEAKHALELDPLALSLNAFMAMTHYFGREYDKAIEHASRTVDMDPNFFPGYFYLGMAYQVNGQFAEAAAALQQARVLSNNNTLMVASLGGAFAAWGKQEEARNILRELEQMNRRKYVSQVFVAAILTGLGEIDQALNTELVPGITGVGAFGHSPGQMALEISSAGEHLLFVADAIVHPLHLEYPETIGATDHCPSQMVATRLRLLEKAAREKPLVSTSHFAFPGLGHVVPKGERWEWQPIPAS